MSRVVTEFDVRIAELKLKAEEIKASFRAISQAAADTKLGERMEAGMKASTLNEFRGFKEGAKKAAHDAAVAAAAEWKAIVTPALNESWGMHRAGAGGALGLSPGNARRYAMGNVGMQVQDIAVQAQMGTSPLTIMAQQGSQLASIFGPGGMILGGVVAIGGALLMAGKKSDEAFREMIKGAADFHAELGKIIESGTVDSISEAMGKLAKRQDEIAQAAQRLNSGSFASFAAGSLATLTGGQGLEQKKYDAATAGRMAAFDEQALNSAALITSERMLQIATLKAAGKEKEAAALEREFKLLDEIQKIESSSLADATKKALIENARSISAAGGNDSVEQEKKWKEAAEKRSAAAKEFADAEHAVEVAGMTQAEKLLDLGKQRLELERKIAAAGDDDEKIRLATERERIEAQIVSTQVGMGKEGESAAKDREEKIAALRKQIAGKAEDLGKAILKLNEPPPTTYHAPGAASSAFDWAMGGGASLVTESQDRNTDAIKELRDEIESLRKGLPENFNVIPLFGA